MRCREARNRMIQNTPGQTGRPQDPELRDHLTNCRNCADQAAATGLLNRLLAVTGVNDETYPTSIEIQKQQVEARVKTNDIPRLTGRLLPIIHLPRWSLAAAAIVLIALAIIPFASYRTVGYDLNLEGISRDLGEDDEQICLLLDQLGLVEAGVDVIGCDTTCSLSILDLKTEREANLVVGALARLNTATMTSNIVPIRAKTSRSLLDQAHAIIRRGDS